NLLVALNPQTDDEERLTPLGLSGVLAAGGIELGNDFVIERREEAMLPQGQGETYLATPKQHAITKGMVNDDAERRIDVLVTLSQSVHATPTGSPAPLLVTSDKSFSLRDMRTLTMEGKHVEKGPADPAGPFNV